MNPTIDLLKAHRSIRKFTDEAVTDEQVREIVSAGQAAATSSNVQAVSVIQVNQPAMRESMAELAGGQPWVTTAGAFLVWCADLRRSGAACSRAGGEFEIGMTEHFLIATVDVALAAGRVAELHHNPALSAGNPPPGARIQGHSPQWTIKRRRAP